MEKSDTSHGKLTAEAAESTSTRSRQQEECTTAMIPMVRVMLVTSLKVPPYQSIQAHVQPEGHPVLAGPLLLQYRPDVEETLGVRAEDVLIDPSSDETPIVLLSNTTGFTQRLDAGEYLGGATPATPVELPHSDDTAHTFSITTHVEAEEKERMEVRKKQLGELLQKPDLPPQEENTLMEFLSENHHVFSLEDRER